MNPLFIRAAPYVAAIVVIGALTAAVYAKGYSDANTKWELRMLEAESRKEKRGRAATREALEGYRSDVEKIRSRAPAPVVRVCPSQRVSQSSGGTADPSPDGQPRTLGERVEEARDIGGFTADILDDADLAASRCNRLIEWFREAQKN